MANYILVPLDPRDDVEEIMPSVEQVAQTGMTVIFLISYQANGLFENRRIRAELSGKGMPTDRKALMKYSYDKQTRLADQRISIARETLHGRGVEVIAYVYMNRLRSVLNRYRRNGGIHRVLMRRKNAIPMIGFFRGIIALFSAFTRSKDPILSRTHTTAGKFSRLILAKT
jgi:hypothetical protein